MVYLRYLNFLICGFFAFIIPHLRFPDRSRFMLQTLNPSSAGLFRYYLRSLFPVFALFTVVFACISFTDWPNPAYALADKLIIFVSATFLMSAIGLLAAVRYARIGAISQEWQEGERGASFLNTLQAVGQAPSMPTGSFPSLFSTMYIGAGGMMMVVAGAWLGGVFGSVYAEAVPGVLLLAIAIAKLYGIKPVFDRFFYHTNAFYNELFLNPKAVEEGREPLRFDALYWVPGRWKAAAWFSMLQLDRKLPAGRLLVVGHLLLWSLFYTGVNDAVISGFLVLLIGGKCMLGYRLVTPAFAPLLFQYRLHGPADWIAVRFFTNIRWVPLLAISLFVVSLVSQRVDASFIGYWVAADLLISLAAAVLLTTLHEFRFRKVYQ